MINMNIREMKIFKSVYETESMTLTAEKLFISQPAVSKTISDIEKHLGLNLFNRNNGKLQRNKNASKYYDQVCKVLNEIEILNNIDKDKKSKEIHLVSSITLANTILGNVMNKFDENLKISIVNADEVVKMIKLKQCDIGIVEGTYYDEELKSQKIHYVPLSFFTLKNNNIDIQTVDELVEYPILLREKGSSIRTAFDELLFKHSLYYEARFNSVNSEAIMQIMKELNTNAISLLPKSLIDKRYFKLVSIPDIVLETSIQLIYRKDHLISNSERNLMNLLKKECSHEFM